MSKKAKRTALLLLMLVLALSPLPQAFASGGKLVYEVTYTDDDLSTPLDWYNSAYFDDPDYKENRFVQYWWETPITPGGPRDTGFYAVYRDDGIYIFFQSNEQERDSANVLKNSSIELFVKYGLGDIPYHQMIIHTDGRDIEYYEWQTEYRDNLPLKGNVTVINEELPTGWGTLLIIPWSTAYKYVPLSGEDWEFSMIRWSPSHSPTWGGKVHQVGRFNIFDFEAPTATQRTSIQKEVITQAWDAFEDAVTRLQGIWLNGDTDDANFYNTKVLPLITAGQANGAQIPNLGTLNPSQVDDLYQHIDSWFELERDVEAQRASYIRDFFFSTGTVVVPDPAEAPGKPALSDNNGHDNGLLDGDYSITMNLWWGNNGDLYKLYENGALIDTQSLTAQSPQAQSAVTAISGRPNGTYRYYAELINSSGTTASEELTVTVTHAAPAAPVLSSNNWDGDGNFDIQMNMWWGTNGTTYRLYENGVLIEEQTLAAASPQAQAASTAIRGKAVGSYEYRAELVNGSGATSSNTITVQVSH